MFAQSILTSGEQGIDSAPQQMAMHLLKLVTEIMVDDVSLAEQMRTAVMAIWLAEKRTYDPNLAWIAWRDIQRAEDQLRAHLCWALRREYIDYPCFDRAMGELSKAAQHRLSQIVGNRKETFRC